MFAVVEDRKIKCRYKTIRTTRLGQGVNATKMLCAEAMERTVRAFEEYRAMADKWDPAAPILCFATSAVRDSSNKAEFLRLVKERCGFEVDVISGQEEAKCGFLGVLGDGTGGIIDIGGGSTEILFGANGEIGYLNSFNIGSVRALEIFGQQRAPEAKEWACGFFKTIEWKGNKGKLPFYAIGGTATSLAAIDLKLTAYDPEKVQDYRLYKDNIAQMLDMFLKLSVEERRQITGMEPQRADVIVFGASILSAFYDAAEVEYVTVSERDNMEGYLMKKIAYAY